MDANPTMAVVEMRTPISKNTYYFTKNQIFRLESYSNLVYCFLLLCTLLLIYESFNGASYVSVLASCAIIGSILAFMMLWVYPKERRMPKFSHAEVIREPAVRKIQWKSISKIRMEERQLVFFEDGNQKKGHLRGNPQDAAKLFKSELGRSFTQSK